MIKNYGSSQNSRRIIFLLFFVAIFFVVAFFGYNAWKQQQVDVDVVRTEIPLDLPVVVPDDIPVSVPFVEHINAFLRNNALELATEKTDNHAYGGYPIPLKNQKIKILKNIAYTVGYCEKRKNPLWVAYRYDRKNGRNELKRPGGFKQDKRTESQIKSSVFTKSGYDRGHMAPNAGIALRFGEKAQNETFLMTNIVPQKPNLNRKVWKRLEDIENKLANSFESVWIFTGPIFDDDKEFIKSEVEIPDEFYKIIIDEENNCVRTLSFIVSQNVTGKEPVESFFASIKEIQEKTGLDFMAPMDDKYEVPMENLVHDAIWR